MRSAIQRRRIARYRPAAPRDTGVTAAAALRTDCAAAPCRNTAASLGLACLLALLSCLPVPFASAQSQPQPATDSLFAVSDIDLQTPAFDRIVMRDGTVHECEPLEPRPLGDLKSSDRIQYRPLDGGGEPQEVLWSRVKQVVYFEDLLLRKVEQLLGQGQYDDAFDYLQAARRRAADWPGLEQALERLLFEEATALLGSGDNLRAANLLAELRDRNPDYVDLGSTYDRAAGQLLDRAYRNRQYRQLRWLLERFERQFPDRAVVQQHREQMIALARRRVAEAVTREEQGKLSEAARLVHEATLIWPELPGLEQHLQRIFGKHTRIVVAVDQLPPVRGLGRETAAQQRVDGLIFQSLIAPAQTPEPEHYDPQLAQRYEISDLGRRVTFHLPVNQKWSDGAPLTAMDVAYAMSLQLDRTAPTYRSHLAEVSPTLQAPDPWTFVVDFSVPPLRPEAFFQFPVVPQHAIAGRGRPVGRGAAAGVQHPLPSSGPFFPAAQTESETAYRTNPHLISGDAAAIDELIERRYSNGEDALRALVQGRVMLVEHVAPFRLQKARRVPHVIVARYGAARVHLIAFDFRSAALRLRSLRRALVYAIDRHGILRNDLLAGVEGESGAVLPSLLRRESPYARTSLKPRPYEPLLAAALVTLAKNQLGGAMPRLKLHHPPRDVARIACRRIREDLQAAGIEVQLVERAQEQLARSLGDGETLDMVYRIVTIREPIVEAQSVLEVVPSDAQETAQFSSAWLRELLGRLRQAPNLPAAQAILQEIDQVVHDEVAVLPLWQIADYFAYDRRLSGVGEEPLDLYANVQRWRWQPTVVKDSFARQ